MSLRVGNIVAGLSLALATALGLSSGGAIAADIWPYIDRSGLYRAVVIEGQIEEGDYDTFIKIVQENQAKINGIYLFTPGGDFVEGMKIGRAVRALELSSQAPMMDSNGNPVCDTGFGPKPKAPENCTCASAGFFIHIGAIHRGGTYLAVHRPYFSKGKFGDLPQDEAMKAFDALQNSARDYMEEMGVPKHIQEDVLGTPSDKVLLLDDKTIKTYFWQELPYRHEWVRNRCSIMTSSDEARFDLYAKRLIATKNPREAGLSKSEWSDLEDLNKKKGQEQDCAVKINNQSRIEAYANFFKTKPNDASGQNFNVWAESTMYIGRKFNKITPDEEFNEELQSGFTFLSKKFTATSPITILSGRTKSKTVTRVSVISQPDPSPDYIKSVIDVLSKAWGSPSGGDGIATWTWTTKDYRSNLKFEPVSASGPYLALVVEAK